MARSCSQHGTVLYVNSIVMQKPNLKQGGKFIHKLWRKVGSLFRGLRRSREGFWVYTPFLLPWHHVRWLRLINRCLLQLQLGVVCHKLGMRNPVIWVACPTAWHVAVNMKRSRLVYQRTDSFEDFPGVDVPLIRDCDKKLKAVADLTIFVNRMLYEQECGECKKAVYMDHGVDYEMFASAGESGEIPSEMQQVREPVVGFFGQIDDYRVDMSFIEKVIDYLPQMSFVFVGEATTDCSRLAMKKNVWMLGQRPYDQIPLYGKCFNVAIMPWRQNRWVQAANPIKLNEYLALGKPVVSTPFPELKKHGDVVYEARTPEEFAKCIERAVNEDCPTRIADRMGKVRKRTWDAQARFVLGHLFGNNGYLAADRDRTTNRNRRAEHPQDFNNVMDRKRVNIQGVGVDNVSFEEATHRIERLIRTGESHYVCVASIQDIVIAQKDRRFRQIVNHADLLTPDGWPVVWAMRAKGCMQRQRVTGPDLMLAICERSVKANYSHFLYGGAKGVAELAAHKLIERFSGLAVKGVYAPPFRPLTEQEDADVVEMLNSSGADILWVCLGTPKQHFWIEEHLDRVKIPVMIAVGAAFDFHSGRLERASRWMQNYGLEWLHRVRQEPIRLGPRYLRCIPSFTFRQILQLLGIRHWSL
jgi:exopolysaccharide biosynthesis WecB/TagA/CpsF family protein